MLLDYYWRFSDFVALRRRPPCELCSNGLFNDNKSSGFIHQDRNYILMFNLWHFSFGCVSLTALAVCSEAYFSAVAKMGDHALRTLSSHSFGRCIVKNALPDSLVLKTFSTECFHELWHWKQPENSFSSQVDTEVRPHIEWHILHYRWALFFIVSTTVSSYRSSNQTSL